MGWAPVAASAGDATMNLDAVKDDALLENLPEPRSLFKPSIGRARLARPGHRPGSCASSTQTPHGTAQL